MRSRDRVRVRVRVMCRVRARCVGLGLTRVQKNTTDKMHEFRAETFVERTLANLFKQPLHHKQIRKRKKEPRDLSSESSSSDEESSAKKKEECRHRDKREALRREYVSVTLTLTLTLSFALVCVCVCVYHPRCCPRHCLLHRYHSVKSQSQRSG
jgi:hypothetical protein